MPVGNQTDFSTFNTMKQKKILLKSGPTRRQLRLFFKEAKRDNRVDVGSAINEHTISNKTIDWSYLFSSRGVCKVVLTT